MSSANIIRSSTEDAFLRSYNKNSSSPKMEPWGTSHFLKDPRKLGNTRKVSKPHRMIA